MNRETYTVTVRTQNGKARSVQRHFKQTADQVEQWRQRTRAGMERGGIWTVKAIAE